VTTWTPAAFTLRRSALRGARGLGRLARLRPLDLGRWLLVVPATARVGRIRRLRLIAEDYTPGDLSDAFTLVPGHRRPDLLPF
jgi:hypothetical protein